MTKKTEKSAKVSVDKRKVVVLNESDLIHVSGGKGGKANAQDISIT